MVKIKKFWPEVVTAGVWFWANFGTAVIAFVGSHPHIATSIAGAAVFAARVSTSPTAKA
jgi:hypothetical protein